MLKTALTLAFVEGRRFEGEAKLKCTIELGPNGGLRLTTPGGTELDFVASSAVAIEELHRILVQVQAGNPLPSQSALNGRLAAAEKRYDNLRFQHECRAKIDWSRPEPARRVVSSEPIVKKKETDIQKLAKVCTFTL